MNIKGLRRWLGCISLGLAVAISGCGAGSSETGAPTGTTSAAAGVATLNISSTKAIISSDNSESATLTIQALSSANAVMAGMVVNLSANTGVLSQQSVTTDDRGQATVDFSSGVASSTNRTATITATAGTASATYSIDLVGSSVSMTATSTSLTADGLNPVTITVTTLSKSGAPLADVDVTLAKSGGTGAVAFNRTTGKTSADGTFIASVSGTGAGPVTVSASALGQVSTLDLTVSSPVVGKFGITEVRVNGSLISIVSGVAAMSTGQTMTFTVAAPAPTANVTFVTSQGQFGASNIATVPVVGGVATASLTTTQAGIADVVITDAADAARTERLTVGMTASVPFSMTLQATPSIIAKSFGGTVSSSNIVAKVLDAAGQPVGNALVVFSILDGTQTGGGEHFSTPVATSATVPTSTAALGEAVTTFFSGSLSSQGSGVVIKATVAGQPVTAQTAVTIGGTAGSIVFGESTKIASIANDTAYEYPLSVVVTDVAGNPVPEQIVNLSIWPIAFNLDTVACSASNLLWRYNEDRNENTVLDGDSDLATCAGQDEDGDRTPFNPANPSAARPLGQCGGTSNGTLTPVNSAGGSVPKTVTTAANGLASFKLTYAKSSAIWTYVRLRATTGVQGSETVAERYLALPGLDADITPRCFLTNPYTN